MFENNDKPATKIDFKKIVQNIKFEKRTVPEQFESLKTIHLGKLEALETVSKIIYKSTNTEAGRMMLKGHLSAKDYKKIKKKDDIDSFCEALSVSLGESINKDFTAQMIFIYSFTMLDAFMEDLLEHLLKIDPAPLNKIGKQYSVEEILQYETREDFVEHLIEKKLNNYGHMSFSKKIQFLVKNYKFHIHKEIQKSYDELHKNWEMRNLFVHKSGYPTKEFVREFPEFEVNSKIMAKSRLVLYNFDYMKKMITYTCDYFLKPLSKEQ